VARLFFASLVTLGLLIGMVIGCVLAVIVAAGEVNLTVAIVLNPEQIELLPEQPPAGL
jgi:hypothetical protein